jgi:flap endonuclease-1
MGVNLTPIVMKRVLRLDHLRGRSFAVDGNNVLYQFLALIRLPDGRPLTDKAGAVTSHLVGLLFRTTRLISDYDMDLVFVFDGRPPSLKGEELAARREVRQKALQEYDKAVRRRDYVAAWSKAVTSTRLTSDLVEDAKRLLTLLGIPWVQAPSEGEAQAAYMCSRGEVWATATRDYDALLYGSPRLLRYLTVSGREFLPSKGTSRPLKPELIELEEFLKALRLNRKQLVDLAILIGTDYSPGVRGIGPKKGLRLLRRFGSLENLPAEFRDRLPDEFQSIRELFLHPSVEEDYEVAHGDVDEEGVVEFLCERRAFSEERVRAAIQRLRRRRQPTLRDFGA